MTDSTPATAASPAHNPSYGPPEPTQSGGSPTAREDHEGVREVDLPAGAPEWDRLDWIARVWREVAADYCSHEGVGKSCAKCRGVVSDVADLLQERTSA